MSDVENENSNRESQLYAKKWIVNYATNGLSLCKDLHCLYGEKKIGKGCLRIGRRYPSPFDKDSIAINWFHAKCMFNQQQRSRVGTQILGALEDMDGVDNILLADQDLIQELIEGNVELVGSTSNPGASEPGRRESGVTVKSASSIKKAAKKKSESGPKDRRKSLNRRDAGRVLMM